MLSPRPWLNAAAIAALAFSAGTAHAQTSSASSEIAGFSYELIDLDLADDITPAISFSDWMVSTSYVEALPDDVEHDTIDRFGSTAMTRPNGRAATSADGVNWSASASYERASPYFQLYSAYSFYGMDFELTPATGVLFRATVNVNAEHDGLGTRSEASARMFGYMSEFGNEGFEESAFTDQVAIESGSRVYYLSGYLHSGTEALGGTFGIGNAAVATFYGVPGQVPEPGTWVMMLAGLGLVGWRLKRAK